MKSICLSRTVVTSVNTVKYWQQVIKGLLTTCFIFHTIAVEMKHKDYLETVALASTSHPLAVSQSIFKPQYL